MILDDASLTFNSEPTLVSDDIIDTFLDLRTFSIESFIIVA